jgi:proteic killer suppression protein
MIKSFGDKQTEALFNDEFVREFQGIAPRAKRRLEMLHAATQLADLLTPPSNHLERLKGTLKEFHSIRIDDQYRIVFRWVSRDAHDVTITDYHR